MIIQHNIASMNAQRMLQTTTTRQKKSAEKLSSGYRINRSSDDAAGLSISEKMRRQIRGLTRASINNDDGISMAQTAEGALSEVHDMLHRLEELAVQAATETLSRNDRRDIQAEVDQIITEIDRVSETTKFNETYLLKGGNGEETRYLNIHDAGLKGIIGNSTDGPGHGTFTMNRLNSSDQVMIAGRVYTIGTGKADVQNIINTTGVGGDTVTVNDAVTYHIIDLAKDAGGNELPAKQATAISEQINSSTRKVNIGTSETYSLNDSYGVAQFKSTVAGSVNNSTQTVVIAGDNNGHDGTYTLLSGGYRAALSANVANAVNSNTLNVTVGGTTYKFKNANGYVATLKSDLANMALTASTVTCNGNTFVLRQGSSVAEMRNNVTSELSSLSLPTTISIYDSDTSQSTSYRVIDDSETVDPAAIPQEINLSTITSQINSLSDNSIVNFAGNSYMLQNYNAAYVSATLSSVADDTEVTIDGSGKYMAESSVYSLSQVRSIITDTSQTAYGTNVTINGSSGTSKYTVRPYDVNTVKNYITSASVGGGDSATTSVTVDGAKYALRNYDLNSVKSRVGGYGISEYNDDTTVGGVITVDGTSYTAETNLFRQAICIAYGEDQQTVVTTPGADRDDLFQDGYKVTYKGKSYYLMSDTNMDGYDDTDNFIVTEGRAYKIIAKELQRASSIGATDTEAVVYDKNNNEIIDNVTMAADFLVTPTSDDSLVRFEIDRGSMHVPKELEVNIHAGTDADMNNKIGVEIRAMSAERLGLKNLNMVDDIGICATYAIDAISDAISEVSRQRSLLGAVQNRMEHTIRNLDNVVENTTSSESRLRDTDMADEMVTYSRDNILAQAGQAMLVQANKTSESVTSLLS
ncbi:flagellin N-terminal helical domain-containing protein [Butyrivibrio sp. NC2002]|uniref:flagellin N-terminal helical domain-containing protein n=1 Tax=Butyrivibrio sp. NC2002 TaxID=1410610 RepID=UPI00068A33DC|nr:flagellin [Butyrivibrio sp. NC2002]